jgi:hypothetical protein
MDAYTEPQSEWVGDFLLGADAIAAFLTSIGLPTVPQQVYYARKIHRLPIGRYSRYLIASKRKLIRAVQALVSIRGNQNHDQEAPSNSAGCRARPHEAPSRSRSRHRC